ncbi:MAG TPA: peptidylprolyl isomerase [Bryobacteraceae bacterium]|jgi:cyclophilin family peptidyl-prolyl cis-trans isomerase|nr:peptidylprolyl isomerase [Bryobacteraceae bacterium]
MASKLLAAALVLSTQSFSQTPAHKPLKPGLYAVFDTSQGEFTAELFEKYTPIAVSNFIGLAQGTRAWLDPATNKPVKRRMYDNITFHRVVRGIMIQSGDPTGTGKHNCGFRIRDEFLPGLAFDHSGRLAVANTGQPDSGGCQFFITDDVMREWNNEYTIFGQVIEGMNVVDAINKLPGHGDKPDNPAILRSVTIKRVSKPKKE